MVPAKNGKNVTILKQTDVILTMSIDNKNNIPNLEDKDVIYVKEYWKDSKNTPENFFKMMETIEESSKEGVIKIKVTGNTEDNNRHIAAHRRMAAALGFSIGSFGINGEECLAKISEGDDNDPRVKGAKRDREYMKLYFSKYSNYPPEVTFKGVKSIVENYTDRLTFFIGVDKDGKLDEESKAQLSTRRIIARSLGYKVGKFESHPKNVSAVAKIR